MSEEQKQTENHNDTDKSILGKNTTTDSSMTDESKVTTSKSAQKQSNKTMTKIKAPISKLSIVAIILTAALGAGLYFHGHQQTNKQNVVIAQLQQELTSLKETLQQDMQATMTGTQSKQNQLLQEYEQRLNTQLSEQQRQQQQFANKISDAIQVNDSALQKLHEQLAAMSPSNNNTWLISQANYLVNLASRKIWSEQDYVTARLLLKSADANLAEINDPSLLPTRQSISRDIAKLAQISYVDLDGIVIQIMQLAEQVIELPFVDNYYDIDLAASQHDDSFIDNSQVTEANPDTITSEEISQSISDWSSNLYKSTLSFANKFITVEKYDTFSECVATAGKDTTLLDKCRVYQALMTPEQATYLKENIRLQLFIAAQSVLRHNEQIYQRALLDVSTWVNAYFDTQSPATRVFLDEISSLQKQSISNENVPEKLESAEALERLMQTRVRSFLSN